MYCGDCKKSVLPGNYTNHLRTRGCVSNTLRNR